VGLILIDKPLQEIPVEILGLARNFCSTNPKPISTHSTTPNNISPAHHRKDEVDMERHRAGADVAGAAGHCPLQDAATSAHSNVRRPLRLRRSHNHNHIMLTTSTTAVPASRSAVSAPSTPAKSSSPRSNSSRNLKPRSTRSPSSRISTRSTAIL
jgi:hypothetical protein